LISSISAESQDIRLFLNGALVLAAVSNCPRLQLDPTTANTFDWPTQLDLGNQVLRVTASNNAGAGLPGFPGLQNPAPGMHAFGAYSSAIVDIAAPGEFQPLMASGTQSTVTCRGTSVSVGYVAGAVGLAIASDPTLRARGVAALKARIIGCGERPPSLAGAVIDRRRLNLLNIVDPNRTCL